MHRLAVNAIYIINTLQIKKSQWETDILEIMTHWGLVTKNVTEILQKQAQIKLQRKETIKKSQICLFFHYCNKHYCTNSTKFYKQYTKNEAIITQVISWNLRHELSTILPNVKSKTSKATQSLVWFLLQQSNRQLLED